MIDTHSHIQFKVFDQDRDEVIKRALIAGVENIVAVGTDVESSKKAVEIAEHYPEVYASVGIHPHHVFNYLSCHSELVSESTLRQEKILKRVQDDKQELEKLLILPKVIAIGETGLDSHLYPSTKYQNYKISVEFLGIQKIVFIEQIKLALKYQKALIIHNRDQVKELLRTLEEYWDPFFEGRTVFHCCESDGKLLDFAIKHHVFIGVDGDVTYDKEKQEFVRKIPLELLVLETDSPFFIPEPLKSTGIKRNEPANLVLIANIIADLKGASIDEANVQFLSSTQQLFDLE